MSITASASRRLAGSATSSCSRLLPSICTFSALSRTSRGVSGPHRAGIAQLCPSVSLSALHCSSNTFASFSSSSSSVSSSSSSSACTAPVTALTSLSEDEISLVESVRKMSATLIAPHVRQMDEVGELHPSILPGLFEAGLMGIEIPAEHGGSGMSFMQSILAIEHIASFCPAIAVIVDIQNTLIDTIVGKHASPELQQKYLPLLASSHLGSFCLSEASSGSDAFAMKTTAKAAKREHPHTGEVVDGYVLNGTKMWISNAKEANLFLIFANAEPSKGYKGITCFLAEKGWKGLSVGKKENKMGIRASSTCELHFDDLFIPSSNIVGELGSGYKIAIGCLNEGRIGIAAQMLGLAEGAFGVSLPYLNQRQQFGQPIANFQGMQFQYADVAMNIEAAKLLTYNAARLKEQRRPFIKEASMAKLFASRVAEMTASKAVEWMGGLGFVKESGVEKFYRDAKIGAIYEGTSNLQLQTIAKIIQKEYAHA